MQNMETNKVQKKCIWWMICKCGHNLRFVLVQISFSKQWKICIDRDHRWNSLTFPLLLIANYTLPWLATKFPDCSLTLRNTGISLTSPCPWQPWLMAWCFNTRASVATLLSTQQCVSSCSWVSGTMLPNLHQTIIYVNTDILISCGCKIKYMQFQGYHF